MGNRIGGILSVRFDGELVQAGAEWEIMLDVPKKEGKAGAATVVGYTEKVSIPGVKGTVTKNPDLDLRKLFGATNATVTVEAPDGTGFVLQEAWFSGDPTLATAEGDVPFEFQGISMTEF